MAWMLLGIALALVLLQGVERFARHREARVQIRELTREIENRATITGSYPKDLAELGWRLYPIFEEGRPVDPWGHPLRFRSPGGDGRAFDVGTTGPDGVKSGDDIGHVP